MPALRIIAAPATLARALAFREVGGAIRDAGGGFAADDGSERILDVKIVVLLIVVREAVDVHDLCQSITCRHGTQDVTLPAAAAASQQYTATMRRAGRERRWVGLHGPGVSSELAVTGRESSASKMAFLKAAPT